MKTIIICLLATGALLASARAKPPAKQWYIFHKDLATRHPTPMVITEWNVTAKQVEKLLTQLEVYIRNPEHVAMWRAVDLKQLKENYDRYSVQVIGTTKKGKKIVHLNFFTQDVMDDKELDAEGGIADLRYNYFRTCDGGANYWRVDYEVESKKFSGFSINGGA